MTYFIIQVVQGALLSCMYTALDYAQTGLIAAVFFFKVSLIYTYAMLWPWVIYSYFLKILNADFHNAFVHTKKMKWY